MYQMSGSRSLTHLLLLTVPFSNRLTASSAVATPLAQVSTVYDFPRGTWLENINQRANGLLLVTSLTEPKVWQIDPAAELDTRHPTVVADIPEKLNTLGITEISSDIFAVIASGYNISSNDLNPGSSSIYKVDFTAAPVSTSKIADFPDAKLLNGLTFLPPSTAHPKGLLLITDSVLGVVWSLDLGGAEPEIWSQDSLLGPCEQGGIGVNGIKYDVQNSMVYLSNTACEGGYLASVSVDRETQQPMGSLEIVGGRAQAAGIDDFDIDSEQRLAFVAAGVQDQADLVDLNTGELQIVAGTFNSTELAQPTAVKIGRTSCDKDRGVIYVTTTGKFPNGIEVDGEVVGGQILAIDTRSSGPRP